jgi:hypothetical protein
LAKGLRSPICRSQVRSYFDDIYRYNPDLIILDNHNLTYDIGCELGIPVWHCSSINIGAYYGSKKNKKHYRYTQKVTGRKLGYCPWGDFGVEPPEGHEWVRPYYIKGIGSNSSHIGILDDLDRARALCKILNCIGGVNIFSYGVEGDYSGLELGGIDDIDTYREYLGGWEYCFTTGSTSYLSDALYNGHGTLVVSPWIGDLEQEINSILCERYNLGINVGSIERMGHYSVEYLRKLVGSGKRLEERPGIYNLDELVKKG